MRDDADLGAAISLLRDDEPRRPLGVAEERHRLVRVRARVRVGVRVGARVRTRVSTCTVKRGTACRCTCACTVSHMHCEERNRLLTRTCTVHARTCT